MKQILSDTLPLFMVPVLQIVHEFPRLVNGKIDRQALIAGYEKSEVLTLAYTNDELEPLENEADRTRARVILTSIGIFFAHLAKDTSGYKQKCTQFLTLPSGTVFYALSHGVIHLARSVGFENQLNRSF